MAHFMARHGGSPVCTVIKVRRESKTHCFAVA